MSAGSDRKCCRELTILSFGQAYIALHRCYKLLPLTVDADGKAA